MSPRAFRFRAIALALALTAAAAPGAARAQPLHFSTYFGGSLEESLRDVEIDDAGFVYAAGGSFTALPGCGSLSGSMDVLVVKLDQAGTRIWCRLIGGGGYDRAYDLAVAPDGDLLVGGRAGAGFPVTAGAFDQSFAGSPNVAPYGPQDGFVCKLRAADGGIRWCTYFGGTGKRIVRGIDVDGRGDVYLASGSCTDLESDPAYPMVNQRNTGGPGCDAVVAKLAADGGALRFGRYVGGSDDDGGCGTVAVDDAGQEVYHLTCWTRSADMPVVNGFDGLLGGAIDAHLVRLSADGRRVVYATYVGGSRIDSNGLHGLAYAGDGVIYVETDTDSDDIPGTAGAYQPANPGNPSVGDWGGSCAVWKIDTTQIGAPSLVQATYFGGNGADLCEGVKRAPSGEIVLPASTTSTDREVVGGLSCSSCSDRSGYVGILSSDLRTLHFGSYYGGTSEDSVRAAALRGGLLAAVGQTNSDDYPTTSNAWDRTHEGSSGSSGRDAIITLAVPEPEKAALLLTGFGSVAALYGLGSGRR